MSQQFIRVEVLTGPMDGMGHFTLDGELVIGRGRDADLCLADDLRVAARHARLFAQDGAVWLEDLDSPSGTFIGSTPVGAPTPLSVGIIFTVGNTMVEIRPEGVV